MSLSRNGQSQAGLFVESVPVVFHFLLMRRRDAGENPDKRELFAVNVILVSSFLFRIIRRVRKILLILLLAIMPTQASWAAVASYCEHEQGVAVSHLGHHDHGCSDAKAATAGDESQPASTPFADGDCEVCHGGIVAVAPVPPELLAVTPSSEVLKGAPALPLPDFASHPDRPNWPALA